MSFGILGPLCAYVEDELVLPAPQLRWLLALLLLHNGQPVTDGQLLRLAPGRAAQNRGAYLTAISRLRSWLAGRHIGLQHAAGGYQLSLPAGQVDASRFTSLMSEAEQLRQLGRGQDQARLGLLEAALGEWRAGLLAGAPAELTSDPAATALTLGRAGCARQLGELALAAGQPDRALAHLAALAGQHPYDESLQAIYLRLLAAAGRPAQALRHYEGLRRQLRDELGVAPSAQLQDVYLALLSSDQAGRGQPHRARPDPPPSLNRPFQLPADLPDFVARREAVQALIEALSAGSDGAYPAVASITGIPGVGKSSLAVHTAHLLRDSYPGGQIYLDLASDDVGDVDTHDGLGRVLLALGVAQAALPPSGDARAAMLQSLTASRRLLLVIDNARAAAQVRPLLPANPRCGVLITSRGVLDGLTAWPNVEVAPLEQADALEMLGRIIGQHRIGAEPGAGARITEVCAGLPLAIRIAGTRIAARAHQSLSWFAARLDSDQTRLDELAVGGVTIRGSFDISYHGLVPQAQRALRLLALLEVPDFGAWLAAAALDCPVREAEDHIDSLVGARLLSVAATGGTSQPRFRFHQLSRLYARDMAQSAETGPSRSRALERAYEACLAVAERVDQRMCRSVKLAISSRPRAVAGELISMHRSVKPHTWFAAERAMLVAVVQASADLAWYDLAWDLSLTLQRYLESQHHFRDWTRIVTTGLAAARSGQDRHAEAALLCSLGERHAVDDDHAAAAEAFASALRIARDCGYQRAQAHALRGLSTSHLARAEFREAHAAAQEALDLIDHTADPNAAAEIQMGLGAALHRLGQMDRAGLCYQRARQGFEQVGDRMNLAILLVDLGALYRDAGRFDESEQALLRSARICTEIGFHNGEAFAYCGLGSLLQRRGDTARAEQVLLEALAIVCEHTDLATECKIRRILGELYRPADPARARARFTESIALAAELRLNWQLVLALIGLGEAEQEAGDIAATAAAWRRAHDLLRTIDPERAGQLHGRLEALPVHA